MPKTQPGTCLQLLASVGLIACAFYALGLRFDAVPNPGSETHHLVNGSGIGGLGIHGGEIRPVSFEQQDSQPGDDLFKKQVSPFLKTYCLECHSGVDGEGEMDLAKFGEQSDVDNDLETWSEVLQQIEDGTMPPEDAKQPRKREIQEIKTWILSSLESGASSNQQLGRLRRLNRVEYENTIRDLFRLTRLCFNNPARIVQTTDYFQPATGRMPRYVLAVSYFFNSHRRHSDLPGVSNLPVDPPVEHGFANDQEALSLSPLLMENYLEISTAMLDNSEFAQISDLWDPMFTAPDAVTEEQKVQQGHEQIELFLPRAFRRPVTADEVERYQHLFDVELAESD
jgi:hypothetical protein